MVRPRFEPWSIARTPTRQTCAAGCEKIFEQRSGGKGTTRPELSQALEFVREGDTLHVTKLDRLARSLSDLNTITGKLGP